MTIEQFKSKRMICFIAALIATFCGGFGYSWSILQAAIMGLHADWSPSSIAITYTLQVSLSCIAPLIFGSIIKKLNTKMNVMVGGILYGIGLIGCSFFGTTLPMLYLFYGVFAGVGVGFIYPIMMSYAVKVLPDKGSIASGLMAAAYGSGAVVWAPVANSLIEGMSLKTTFMILGVIFLVAIVAMSFMLSDVPEGYIESITGGAKKENAAPVKKVEDLTRGQMAKTGTFYIMLVTFTLATTSGMLVISQAKSIVANTCGDTLAAKAAICVSVVTLFNTFGRIVWGAVSQKIGPYNVTAILFVIAAVCMGGLAFVTNGFVIVALMALTASCFGGFATLIPPLTADMFGTKYLTENFGTMYVVYAFSAFIGPRLATSLMTTGADGTVSYATAYIVGAVLSAAGIVFAFVLKAKDKKNQAA